MNDDGVDTSQELSKAGGFTYCQPGYCQRIHNQEQRYHEICKRQTIYIHSYSRSLHVIEIYDNILIIELLVSMIFGAQTHDIHLDDIFCSLFPPKIVLKKRATYKNVCK